VIFSHPQIDSQPTRYAFVPLSVDLSTKLNHWIVVVFDKATKILYYFDPSSKNNTINDVLECFAKRAGQIMWRKSSKIASFKSHISYIPLHICKFNCDIEMAK